MRDRDGAIRAHALIDAADAERVLALRWHLNSNGYVVHTMHEDGRTRKLRLHRFLMDMQPGDPREVDHENGDPRDNRRSNLRVGTRALNQQNRKGAYGSSRYRGVIYCKQTGRWIAKVGLGGRSHHLGRFDTEREAAEVAAAFRAEHMPFSAEAAAA